MDEKSNGEGKVERKVSESFGINGHNRKRPNQTWNPRQTRVIAKSTKGK